MIPSSKDVEFAIGYMKYEQELFISTAHSDIGGSMHWITGGSDTGSVLVVAGSILVVTDTDQDTDVGPETGSLSSQLVDTHQL